ncbi:hypothetical protein IHE44_0000571 [Lamprotornis superbus]|uniref:Uncharacterized protein n=1 Tax=Lamprotornis superbus TaxID=245042 RepID=A0A835U0P6_9PASS|nr:hypothetical protein IHE44_0000571 [Lamprotornis superbus]
MSGSKSQNCLWNTVIGGLTSNHKEKPKLTIINDPRPPEEILADELPPVDSPEALIAVIDVSDSEEEHRYYGRRSLSRASGIIEYNRVVAVPAPPPSSLALGLSQ